ncbi:unnamed protein product [Eruca vesicaria subsp. sativa]|uniref:Uncharacterized protein n=1 Tax=Eruca vesicaria subsp. sativa TaxID=29727 RepID=A0ABC8M6U3_ERUVS|nr:unnamed protein product [Eruca vesicaria subsp. sativa]
MMLGFCKVGAISDESVKRLCLLDQIEIQFEEGSDDIKAESKDGADLSVGRQKIMLEYMAA